MKSIIRFFKFFLECEAALVRLDEQMAKDNRPHRNNPAEIFAYITAQDQVVWVMAQRGNRRAIQQVARALGRRPPRTRAEETRVMNAVSARLLAWARTHKEDFQG